MPVIGAVCPLNNEPVLTLDCLKCSLEHPRCEYDTVVLADALKNRRVDGLSVTEILSEFPRKTLLEKLVDYYVKPDVGYYAVRGKWVHEAKRAVYLAPELGRFMREQRLAYPDPPITGQVDIYYVNRYCLIDYKTTSRMVEQPRDGDVCQANVYVELLRANDFRVDEAYITYLTFSSHKKFQIPIWESARIHELIVETYNFMKECIDAREVPPRQFCTEGDRGWICKYCAFKDWCKDNPDWTEVKEGMIWLPESN